MSDSKRIDIKELHELLVVCSSKDPADYIERELCWRWDVDHLMNDIDNLDKETGK